MADKKHKKRKKDPADRAMQIATLAGVGLLLLLVAAKILVELLTYYIITK